MHLPFFLSSPLFNKYLLGVSYPGGTEQGDVGHIGIEHLAFILMKLAF